MDERVLREPAGQRAEIRRRQIIDAARECFCTSGFHGASMAEIASTARMSVGQIYRHFANKEALIAAIVEQGLAERIDHIAALEQAARENGQDLAAAAAEVKHREPPNPADDVRRSALTLEIVAEAARNPTVAGIVQRSDSTLLRRTADVIAAARPDWSLERVYAAVSVITALYEGWMQRAIADPSALTPEAEQLRAELVAHALQP
jgi:AcrR family transcriptional regulator